MYRFLHSLLFRRGIGPFVLLTIVAIVTATIPLTVFHGSLQNLMAASVGTSSTGPHDLPITSSATLTLSAPPYMPGTPFAVTYGAQVTLQRVVDNAPAIASWNNNQTLTPNQGQRFVGLQITVTNTGSTAMGPAIPVIKTTDPDPSYTASGTDATIPGCQPFIQSPPASLQPGQSITGCDIYSMPISDQVVAVTYNYGGFPNATANGKWTIGSTNGGTTPTSQAIIVGLTLHQKPTTPLWKLDLLATLDKTRLNTITCPAQITVQSVSQTAPINISTSVCQHGQPQASVEILFPVFAGNARLQPNANTTFKAQLSNKTNQNISQLTATILTPPPPIWVGVGDSYSSGHNQKLNILCFPVVRGSNACSITWNDKNFSWVTRAVNDLNTTYNVPPSWAMVPQVLALSGASTAEMVGHSCDQNLANLPPSANGHFIDCAHQNQLLQMQTLLQNNRNSWNIVSLTGGANEITGSDITWTTILAAFYSQHLQQPSLHPFDITNANDCPDYNAFADQFSPDQGKRRGDLTDTVIQNLLTIFATAHRTDPNARLVDVTYANVDDSTSKCFLTHTLPNGQVIIGDSAVVSYLNQIHQAAVTQYEQTMHSQILQVNTPSLFGPLPIRFTQTTYYGYPHPNDAGQTLIAQGAAKVVQQANGK